MTRINPGQEYKFTLHQPGPRVPSRDDEGRIGAQAASRWICALRAAIDVNDMVLLEESRVETLELACKQRLLCAVRRKRLQGWRLRTALCGCSVHCPEHPPPIFQAFRAQLIHKHKERKLTAHASYKPSLGRSSLVPSSWPGTGALEDSEALP